MKSSIIKVCAYMRYSTENQKELSIEYQREKIIEYCKTKGYTLVEEFADKAASGTNDTREAFQKMISAAQNSPEWCKVIVYNNSRFARKSTDSLKYRQILAICKIEVESTTEQNDKTPEGKVMRNIGFAFDEYYVDKCSQHTHAAMLTKAGKGEHCGGTAPLGYDIVGNKLVINEFEAETVKMIFDMYARNYSYNDMIKLLNSESRTTKSGESFTKNSFRHILTNPKYKGYFVWNRASAKDELNRRNSSLQKPEEEQVVVKNGCPAIVSEALFDKVQERMHGNRSNALNHGKYHYMLGGMDKIICGECGAHMVCSTLKSHGKKYRYYVCPNHKNKEIPCKVKNLRALYLENHIAGNIVVNALNADTLGSINKTLSELYRDNADIDTLKKQLSSINKKITNILAAIENMPDVEDSQLIDLKERLKKCELTKSMLESQIEKATDNRDEISSASLKDVRNKLLRTLIRSKSLEVREFIESTVQEVVVNNDNVTVALSM